jgi:cyclopropane fatty-acyl-phospholipid synthase-like methyltransferase
MLALDERSAPRLYEPGCGIGGGVTQVAQEWPGAAVVGMTLVRRQAQIGRARARALGVANAHVCCGNYLAAPFADASFDGIFAIETAVYTPVSERARLMREMFRLLAPGCRLAVLDGVKLREPTNAGEQACIQDVLDGWTMPSPATPDEFGAHARAAGFEVLQQEDVTAHVYDSALRIARIATHVLRPLSALARIPLLAGSMGPLGFASPRHARRFVAACRSQVAVFDAGLGAYYAQVFRKPH